MPHRHRPLTDEEVKMFAGRAGKVLLQYLETLPKHKIRKIQARWRRNGERVELTNPIRSEAEPQQHGIVRTGTGYVWR